MYVYTRVWTCMIYVYTCICLYVCMYVCMGIYVYVFRYMYVCIETQRARKRPCVCSYIHTYLHTSTRIAR